MKTYIILFRNAAFAVLLFTFSFGQNLQAQDASPNIYFEITKLKKLNNDLMGVEEEIMKPYVQERIEQGNQLEHAFFRVRYPNSDSEDYDYIVMDVFNSFDHLHLGAEKMREIAATVFPNADLQEVVERLEAASKNAGSEVFVIRDEAIPGPEGSGLKPPKFIQVNHMKVLESNSQKYAKMEGEIFKPIHQANANDGNLFDWILLQRILPYGSEWDNNFLTFDIYTEWGDMEKAGSGNLFATVHPKKDVNAIWSEMADLRELKRSEVWELISWVDKPSSKVSYEMVKEGVGDYPMQGQEVVFKSTLMNTEGETIFSTKSLGYDFYSIVGANPYDRYFDKGVKQMKKGGIMTVTLPPDAQDQMTKRMSDEKLVVMKIHLLDIQEPKPNGAELVGKKIEEEGLAAGKQLYATLQNHNSEGYVFREGAMNTLGYQLMGKGQKDAAIYIFDLNRKNFPKSWNACDSLADGYRAIGNIPKAKECYSMALNINPDFEASRDKLAKL